MRDNETEEKLEKINSYGPRYYQDSEIMQRIYQIQAKGIVDYEFEKDEVFAQFSPHTATWGLFLWEEELGIKTILSNSIDLRRAKVLTKLFANPIVTRELMEHIVNLFIPSKKAKVEEIENEYAFHIIIPVEDIGLVKKGIWGAVDEAKPAHLDYTYEGLSAIGEIQLIDDTYHYFVYYKTCGEFSGEKEFSQSDVGNINVTDDTYDYAVEYPVSEKQFMQIDGDPITAIDDTYSFVKDYEVCGVMSTLDKNVTTAQSSAKVDGAIYNVGVHYPVCGEFYAEGE